MSYFDDQFIDWLAGEDTEFGGDAWAERPRRRLIGTEEHLRRMSMASYYDDGGAGQFEDERREQETIETRKAAAKLPTQINVTPQFALAGEATFTVSNGSDIHFTYHINKAEPTPEFTQPSYFIKVLTGPDNSNDFAYIGRVVVNTKYPKLDPIIKLTARSKVNQDTPSYKVALWALRVIWQVARGEYKMPPGYSIKHCGQCGRCGAKLTHPASIDTGMGPGCAALAGVEWAEHTPQTMYSELGRK